MISVKFGKSRAVEVFTMKWTLACDALACNVHDSFEGETNFTCV